MSSLVLMYERQFQIRKLWCLLRLRLFIDFVIGTWVCDAQFGLTLKLNLQKICKLLKTLKIKIHGHNFQAFVSG